MLSRTRAPRHGPRLDGHGCESCTRAGPDGHLYLTTSNRDGRGDPSAGDDHLVRIIRQR
jgi:hypothetical protein